MPRNIVSDMLREGLFTRVVGSRIIYFQRLTSTMDEAVRRAREGAKEGLVVLAEEQTAGRGRFQRAWVSQPGNLYFSILLRPSLDGLQYVSIVSALAVVRAIRKTAGLKATIKWPNDVRIGGKKVSGVLVENSLRANSVEHAIVGIGLNVALDPSITDELAGIATSLNLESGRTINREALLKHILQEMDGLYKLLSPDRASSISGAAIGDGLDMAKAEWRGLLETIGNHVEVRWQEEMYRGYAENVDSAGNLLLRLGDGTLATLPAGEVTSAIGKD